MKEDKKTHGQENKIKRGDAFKILLALQEVSAEFLASRPTTDQALERLTTMVGFNVPRVSYEQAKKALNLTWTPGKPPSATRRVRAGEYREGLRILAQAVRLLYDEFNKPLPDRFLELERAVMSGNPPEVDTKLPSSK